MQVLTHLESHHGQAIERLCEFLRIASVSTQPRHAADVRSAARWVSQYLQSAGLKTEILETAQHPAVYAEWLGAGPSKPTVLIYGHHDVQPVGELDKWTSPPFEPEIRDGRIFARGAADDKGQIFCHMLAVEAFLRTVRMCPVNVKMLIEGEEEIGSPHLTELLEQQRERLRCDLVALSDSAVYAPNQPALALGTRGLLGIEVKITGPSRDLHSGVYGGSVPNPIAVLTRIMAGLHNDKGQVTVPGFYDDVAPIPPAERQAWADLRFDDAAYMAEVGCGLAGEADYSTLERRWARPTLEYNGITGGYQGPGSNTIVPSWASVKITCRLVPNQDPDRVAAAVMSHIRRSAPGGVQVEVDYGHKGARAYAIAPDHRALKAAAMAFEQVYGVPPVRIREGGTLPILPAFKRILDAESVLLGFCHPNCRAHSPNEFFDTHDLLRGARTAAVFLQRIAELY